MNEKLEDLTPNQRRALGKALAALETMASMWGVEIGLRRVSEKLAMKPEAERAKSIAAFIEQAFIEGAYRHYLDRDPSTSRELESASRRGGEADTLTVPKEPTEQWCARLARKCYGAGFSAEKTTLKFCATLIRDVLATAPKFAAPSAGNGGAEGDAP